MSDAPSKPRQPSLGPAAQLRDGQTAPHFARPSSGHSLYQNTLQLFEGRQAVLLDMNGTFMFDGDRFGPTENYFDYYSTLGGNFSESQVNSIISNAYAYLNARYPQVEYRESFPSVISAIRATSSDELSSTEEELLVETFAAHEIGEIDSDHVGAINALASKHKVGAVIDIWSPKPKWEALFIENGLARAFSAISFSSDHGLVKPSPAPFLRVMKQLGVTANDTIFVGDSIRRDLGGANAVGIDCILVGGAVDSNAYACAASFLDLVQGRGYR